MTIKHYHRPGGDDSDRLLPDNYESYLQQFALLDQTRGCHTDKNRARQRLSSLGSGSDESQSCTTATLVARAKQSQSVNSHSL